MSKTNDPSKTTGPAVGPPTPAERSEPAVGLSPRTFANRLFRFDMVLLGLVLVLACRPGQAWLLPVVATALAVLVMSPRFVLAPFIVSLLFLGVTWYVLTLPPARYPRAIWWLPALFVLWVNTDQWFVLGPLTVG